MELDEEGAIQPIAERLAACFRAVEAGDVAEIGRLLDQEPGLIYGQLQDDSTLLMICAAAGHLDVARLLIERGAEVNATCPNGCTAIYAAVDNGHLEMVALLLNHGADQTIRYGNGRWTPMTSVACEGNLAMTRLLKEHWPEGIHQPNGLGQTPVWLAAASGCEAAELVRMLLVAGCDPSIRDERMGLTAVGMARSCHHEACVRVFKWFEAELERAYVLHKGRSVYDDHCTRRRSVQLQCTTPAAAPVYLQERVEAGLPLPRVQLWRPTPLDEEEEGEEGEEEEEVQHQQQAEEVVVSEEERADVSFVVKKLNAELLVELMEGMRLKPDYVSRLIVEGRPRLGGSDDFVLFEEDEEGDEDEEGEEHEEGEEGEDD